MVAIPAPPRAAVMRVGCFTRPRLSCQVTEAGTFNRRLTPAEAAAVRTQNLRLVPVHSVAEIDNIYDQGFLANVRQRLFAAPV